MLYLILTLAVLANGIWSAVARGYAPAEDQTVIRTDHGSYIVCLDENGDPTGAPVFCPDCVLNLLASVPGGAVAAWRSQARPIYLGLGAASQDVPSRASTITARGPPKRLI